MATKTYVTDKDGAVADASTITMPSDRHFRNAWKLNGSVMAEDMAEAKKIFQDKNIIFTKIINQGIYITRSVSTKFKIFTNNNSFYTKVFIQELTKICR